MTRIFRTLCAALCALAWTAPSAGAERLRVAAVADGLTLILADGSALRLAAVRVPSGRTEAGGDAALADAARAALEALIGDRTVLVDGPVRFDRHGRRVASPRLEDGAVLPLALLSAGLVRVEVPEEAAEGPGALYAAEAAARVAGRGFWARPEFAVLDAAAVPPERSGGFVIVEGRVVEAAEQGGRGYLNFGADWKTDFTVTVSPQDLRAIERAGADWAGYAGRRLRVRGWLEDYNGPMIEIRSDAAIEMLGE
jgi:micrococcal nuclease